jgi:hypothetical protein
VPTKTHNFLDIFIILPEYSPPQPQLGRPPSMGWPATLKFFVFILFLKIYIFYFYYPQRDPVPEEKRVKSLINPSTNQELQINIIPEGPKTKKEAIRILVEKGDKI